MLPGHLAEETMLIDIYLPPLKPIIRLVVTVRNRWLSAGVLIGYVPGQTKQACGMAIWLGPVLVGCAVI